jgi:hypothetical protein
MRASKNIDYYRGILVRPRHLKDIYEILCRYSGKLPALSVRCVDGLNLTPETLEDLLGVQNHGTTRIDTIHLKTDYSSSAIISVTLGPYSFHDKSISFDATGDKDDVVAIMSQMDDLVRGCFPWYSYLAIQAFMYSILIGFWPLFIGIVALLRNHDILCSWNSYSIILLVGVLFVGAPLLFRFIFPISIFTLGDGEKQEHKYESRRRLIFQGILLALFVGIVGSIIASRLLNQH